ncbi:MAG: ABC transporter ATP-binding protein [Prosthecochloris sp.]|uniref:ABC transporter ATP-binding protein n=1 Tax=Prosthecochloris sp. ZM_2 TaxID=2045206 RepID=UPI000DF86329|nr:ABC transporter ATP-binding protein [Prosthecochloris sp. ZM_2]MEC9487146.1 ABC transporter ATP-binding protein [Prosthecochloris sp.]RNA65778.1 ABC transporter ATP-binding protein [Prosthecochloris sp. ZM_2]
MSENSNKSGGFRQQQDDLLSRRGRKGSVDRYIISRLLQYIKPYKGLLFAALGITISGAVLGPLRPYITKVAIDDYITPGDMHGLTMVSLVLLAVILLDGVKQFAATYLTQLLGQKAVLNLRMDIFRHLQKLSVRFYDRNPAGRLITRTTNDVEALNEMLSSGLVTIIGDLLQLFFIVGLMLYIDWQLTLIVLGVLPLIIYVTMTFKSLVRAAFQDVRTHLARLNSFLQEHISGMNIVQLFGREEREYQRHADINREYRDANIRTVRYFSVYYPLIELISSIAAGLVIWYSGVRMLNQDISLGVVVSFVQYIWLFFRPLQHLSDKFNIMQTALASSDRIFKLLDEKDVAAVPEQPVELQEFRHDIVFDHVWFAYHGENWVLKDLSFRVERGEKVAIVGATGSGKTTIINVLSRLYPVTRGSLNIDGVDISRVPDASLRRLVGVVMQDVFLFSGTIRENLAFGREGATDREIEEAARRVGADRFIAKLPGGYDYPVRENGAGLSAGQKQLIAFVRALLYNPEILVLDEATSSVDTETEYLIDAATAKLMKGRTSIVIAHRLSTVQHADKIIVMHKGEIRETGSHQELLAARGLYYKLYLLQHPEKIHDMPQAAS